MSKINNSYEYYESSQSLLSMLNNKKTGNKLINQIIADNEAAYKKKMESMGIYSDSGNDKYSQVSKASNSLLDAIEYLGKEDLYKVKADKDEDNSDLLKGITNFVTAYNNEITNLSACGGALNKEFSSELRDAYTANAKELESIGITMGEDGKLIINQDKLPESALNTLKAVFGDNSGYIKSVASSLNSINEILGKVKAMKSTSYNSKGMMI